MPVGVKTPPIPATVSSANVLAADSARPDLAPPGPAESTSSPETPGDDSPAAIPEERFSEERIRAMLRRDFEGLSETKRPDGGYSLHLRGRFMHLSAIVPGPENTPVARCFCEAEDLLQGGKTAAQAHSHSL